MAISGITDKIQVLKETAYGDGGAVGEKVFGITTAFSWKIETSTKQEYALETTGPQALCNCDGVMMVSGTHDFEVTGPQAFEAIFGTISGTGTFSLSVASTLPSYSVKVAEDGTNFNIIKGIKYTKFKIKMARGDKPITVSADWIGQTIEDTGTFTPTTSGTYMPLMYLDGYLALGGSNVTEVEDITIELDRKCVGRRFIEQVTTGKRRLISAIVEGSLSIAVSGNVAAKRAMLQEIFGNTTMTDVRADKNINLYTLRGTQAVNLAITGGRFISLGRKLEKTQEISLQDFAGVGLNITGTGTYQ
jgi:hypothetical protein